jgi:hypothetical protein
MKEILLKNMKVEQYSHGDFVVRKSKELDLAANSNARGADSDEP